MLLTRRTMVKGGAGAVALALANPARAGQPPLPARAVYDRRFTAARDFARAAAAAGLAVRAFAGDVTGLWQDDLRLHWARGGGPVLGLCARPALTCLDQMAHTHGYRVVELTHLTDNGLPLLRWRIAGRGLGASR